MTLAQMESRFFELKGKLAVGQIAEESFKREMEKLRFQDSEGRWWMIGAQSGRWYYYDGTRWLLGQPPSDESTGDAPSTAPEKPAASPIPTPSPRTKEGPWVERVETPPTPPLAPNPTQKPQAAPVPTPRPMTTRPPVGTKPPASPFPSRLKEPAPRGPTLADKVRDEMTHVHMPDVHVPDLHVPEVHAPAQIRRYPPYLIVLGAVVAGLVLVGVMWLLVDNVLPGRPISAFLGRSVAGGGTPTARATGTPSGGANVENILRVADELASKSEFGSALSQYQNAARLAPNNAEVYTHWARSLALTGRIQDAADNAERATRIDTNSADAQAEFARALAWLGEDKDAVAAGEKAVQLDDKNATAHAFLAEAYLRAGRREDAQKESGRALQLDDKNVDAHRAAGWIAVLDGQRDPAIGEWQKVTDLAPEIFFYHYEFGQVYGTYFNNASDAVPEYQRAIQLFAPYVPSHIALGRTLLAQNQSAQAILSFQRALTYDNNSYDAYVGLGLAFQKQDKCGQAIPYFQKSLELDSKGNEALRGMSDCGALAQGQPVPTAVPPAAPDLNAVPTAIVQATVVPLAQTTPTVKPVAAKGTPTPGAAPAAGSKSAGKIAFALFDGTYHLYTANTDGSGRKLVTNLGSGPTFSPDGSQLLYYSWSKEARGIHRIEANGKADETVSLRFEDLLPSWSPDGTRFIYATRAGTGADMSKRSYRLRISDPTARPDQDPADFTVGQYPAWGPKDRVVYRDCGLPTDTCGLAVIDADGENKTALTNINSTAPAWSPDGKYIVFMSDYGGNWDIYSIEATGGSPSRLTTDAAEDGLPTFSPDGKQVAFVSHKDNQWSIWAMGVDGSNAHKLFDLDAAFFGNVAGNSAAQPGQQWWEQRISWGK